MPRFCNVFSGANVFFFALFCVVGASACSHTVHIEVKDQPAAEVKVDGVAVGKAPATYTESIGSKGATYQVEAALPSGQVLQQQVTKSETSLGAVGLGAGVGAGACCGIVGVSAVLALAEVPYGGVVGYLGCPALVVGPLLGFLLAGQSPDSVVLEGTPTTPEAPPSTSTTTTPEPLPPVTTPY